MLVNYYHDGYYYEDDGVITLKDDGVITLKADGVITMELMASILKSG